MMMSRMRSFHRSMIFLLPAGAVLCHSFRQHVDPLLAVALGVHGKGQLDPQKFGLVFRDVFHHRVVHQGMRMRGERVMLLEVGRRHRLVKLRRRIRLHPHELLHRRSLVLTQTWLRSCGALDTCHTYNWSVLPLLAAPSMNHHGAALVLLLTPFLRRDGLHLIPVPSKTLGNLVDERLCLVINFAIILGDRLGQLLEGDQSVRFSMRAFLILICKEL
mmetsp:Transcript_32264/g.67655  ORF Transcript_32264/g.67655 Transcript_32264/m.67655 type:complete len:217 (+) Transcript_32264:955-1605(+)